MNYQIKFGLFVLNICTYFKALLSGWLIKEMHHWYFIWQITIAALYALHYVSLRDYTLGNWLIVMFYLNKIMSFVIPVFLSRFFLKKQPISTSKAVMFIRRYRLSLVTFKVNEKLKPWEVYRNTLYRFLHERHFKDKATWWVHLIHTYMNMNDGER